MENLLIGAQPGFTLFWEDLREYLECLSDRELGHILRMLYGSLMEGKDPEVSRIEKLAYTHLRSNILLQAEKYREACEKNAANSRKRFEKKEGSERSDRPIPTDIDRYPIQTQDQTQNQIQNQDQTETYSSLTKDMSCETQQRETGRGSSFQGYAPSDPLTETAFTPEQHSAFLAFRKAYPRKNNIAQAEALYVKALESVSPEKILTAIKQQMRTDDWQRDRGKYIPSAEKWLRERCWEDEPCEWDDGYVCMNLKH